MTHDTTSLFQPKYRPIKIMFLAIKKLSPWNIRKWEKYRKINADRNVKMFEMRIKSAIIFLKSRGEVRFDVYLLRNRMRLLLKSNFFSFPIFFVETSFNSKLYWIWFTRIKKKLKAFYSNEFSWKKCFWQRTACFYKKMNKSSANL